MQDLYEYAYSINLERQFDIAGNNAIMLYRRFIVN